MSRSSVIAVSFFIGIVIDMFSNTLGMHAAACSLVGMINNPLMSTFSEKDLTENDTPSYRSLGVAGFIKYVISLVLIHHIALFLIESISLFDPIFLIIRIFANVIFTVLFILIIEAFNMDQKRRET